MAEDWAKISRLEARAAAPRPRGCLGVVLVGVISLTGFALIVWLGLEKNVPEGPKAVERLLDPTSKPVPRPRTQAVKPAPLPAKARPPAEDTKVEPVADVVGPSEPPGDPLAPEEVRRRVASVVQIVAWDRNLRPVGSALAGVVSDDGWVLTNSSVADAAYAGFARLRDGRILFVDGVRAQNPTAHAALVKLKGTGLLPCRVSGAGMPAPGKNAWVFSARDTLVVPVSGLIRKRVEFARQFEGFLVRAERPVGEASRGGPVLGVDGTLIGIVLPGAADPLDVYVAPAEALVPLVRQPGGFRSWASAGAAPLAGEGAATLEEAWAALTQEKHGAALELLLRLRAEQAGSAWYWHAVAWLQAKLDLREEAVASYRTAGKLRPADGRLASSLGDVLASLGRHAEAVDAYRAAIDANRKLADTHTSLGHSLRILGRFEQAFRAYDTAVALDARHAEAWLGLGLAYQGIGDFSRALVAWKLAVKNGLGTPAGDEARRLLDEAAGANEEPKPPEPDPEPPKDGDKPR